VRLIEVEAVLSDRLLSNIPQPLAVAVSGGGDSLALMLAAEGWATAHGRELLVLTVDHRLQAAGADWAAVVAAHAKRLGVRALTLAWEGPKPNSGLPAAARLARHRLLAEAARAEGARVILMGHTADDVLEARAMRAAGGSTPDPRDWSPSPVWPEGRGLFLLRPLLGQSRAAIRDWLSERGETWIDDPANEDLRYARPRARRALAGEPELAEEASVTNAAPLALACRMDAGGGLSIARSDVRTADMAAARRFLSAACLCAAGQARPPRRDRLERLESLARGEATFAATLAGARVEGDAERLSFFREAGEAARGGLAPCALPPGEVVVWDGRFELIASRPGQTVQALAGHARRLPDAARRALTALPAGGRGALPLILTADGGEAACPALGEVAGVTARPLAYERLLAACGAVPREPRG
jgi:tRNA(Ile)-lysidine synthase